MSDAEQTETGWTLLRLLIHNALFGVYRYS